MLLLLPPLRQVCGKIAPDYEGAELNVGTVAAVPLGLVVGHSCCWLPSALAPHPIPPLLLLSVTLPQVGGATVSAALVAATGVSKARLG